ncbi:hypothetical protein FM125_08845 [Micrococcus lylae]|uniref:Uncharacterized protein n=1 Tax=Micrococcus lylae TaxID=1273 RepID=A0A1R4JJR9_9MICC|nr:hypothetical protein FM125_08845 [Micrococcus lylae]
MHAGHHHDVGPQRSTAAPGAGRERGLGHGGSPSGRSDCRVRTVVGRDGTGSGTGRGRLYANRSHLR